MPNPTFMAAGIRQKGHYRIPRRGAIIAPKAQKTEGWSTEEVSFLKEAIEVNPQKYRIQDGKFNAALILEEYAIRFPQSHRVCGPGRNQSVQKKARAIAETLFPETFRTTDRAKFKMAAFGKA